MTKKGPKQTLGCLAHINPNFHYAHTDRAPFCDGLCANGIWENGSQIWPRNLRCILKDWIPHWNLSSLKWVSTLEMKEENQRKEFFVCLFLYVNKILKYIEPYRIADAQTFWLIAIAIFTFHHSSVLKIFSICYYVSFGFTQKGKVLINSFSGVFGFFFSDGMSLYSSRWPQTYEPISLPNSGITNSQLLCYTG